MVSPDTTDTTRRDMKSHMTSYTTASSSTSPISAAKKHFDQGFLQSPPSREICTAGMCCISSHLDPFSCVYSGHKQVPFLPRPRRTVARTAAEGQSSEALLDGHDSKYSKIFYDILVRVHFEGMTSVGSQPQV